MIRGVWSTSLTAKPIRSESFGTPFESGETSTRTQVASVLKRLHANSKVFTDPGNVAVSQVPLLLSCPAELKAYGVRLGIAFFVPPVPCLARVAGAEPRPDTAV